MGAYQLVTGSPAQPVLLVDTSGNPYTASSGGGSGNAAASATGAAVPADAGYTGLNSGGNLIGWIGDTSGRAIIAPTGNDVAVTPTIQNASYVSGNNMGGLQTISLGTNCSVLNQITLASQGGLATGKVIYIFFANPTGSTFTDKSTFTIATADLSKLLIAFTLTPSIPTGTTKTFAAQSNMGLGIPSGGTIYLAIVETATETPASTTDLVLTLSSF